MTDIPAGDHTTGTAEVLRVALMRCESELDLLRQSEAGWHEIFINAPVALSLASLADGRLREVNTRYAKLVGMAREELNGRLSSELHQLPADGSPERIAAEIDEHAGVDQVVSHYLRSDGTQRQALSSLQLIEFAGETLILSSTLDTPHGTPTMQNLSDSRERHIAELEAELSAHLAQERKLMGEIGGLCTEAGLLKSDIIKLKQMQLELSSEMETLRKHSVLAAIAPPATEPSANASAAAALPPLPDAPTGPSAAPAVTAAAAHVEPGGPKDALWEVASARLQHVEEQLIKHAAALREQAARMQFGAFPAQ